MSQFHEIVCLLDAPLAQVENLCVFMKCTKVEAFLLM